MSGRIRVCAAVGRACVGAASVEPPDKESGSRRRRRRLAVGGGGVSSTVLTKLCGLPAVCGTQSDERGRAQTETHTTVLGLRKERHYFSAYV